MSDDFFSNVPAARRPHRPPSPAADAHNDFANAISIRFGAADIATARLLPAPDHNTPQRSPSHTPPRPRPPPLPTSPLQPLPPSLQHPFAPVHPTALPPYLADPRTLVLDIRPHAAHAAARITHALSLSVPTTLLKRPLFSLSKLSQMLPSPSSRARFADWSSASSILVYDSDSASAPDNSIIAGLLRKFRAENFTGELAWVRGGFQAVWREARHLTTTELPSPEEDDPDPATPSGTLRTTHLPKAAFSLSSTTAVPPPQLGTVPGSHALPNTPAPSASRAANPFFDTIRQNVELSHGITERIPLRLSRRVRRRIHDLPFRWLQDIARRSALRHPPVARHPGLDGLESGSESSDDPHTSDPDEHDPNVEEGTEVLAMQFYRIELAEQRRLRSIMEHHTRESQVAGPVSFARPRRTPDKVGAGHISADRVQSGVSTQPSAKSAPGTPHPAIFPFSITAGVEKGTKNRYTHIWPFEHARVRLHDSRHQGSHPGRRDRSKHSERGRSTRDRSGGKGKERQEQEQEQEQEQGKQRRSRSSPALGKSEDQETEELVTPSRYSFDFGGQSPIAGTSTTFEGGRAHSTLSPSASVPRVEIEYDVTEQDLGISEPPTPATALPLLTPPFFTPMETPMCARPPQLFSLPSGINVIPAGRGGAQFALPAFSLPSLGPVPSFPLHLSNHMGSLLPSIGEQSWTLESPSSATPFGAFPSRAGSVGEAERDPRTDWSPADDYVNASYVQPLGTRKRYIATQGPLPATYVDFWTLVWEQNVHVIVMLTREIENAMIKCGSYWTDTEYGPLRLELLYTSPPMSPRANLSSTDTPEHGFFAIREPQGKTNGVSRDQSTLITRTFALSHASYPGVPPRRITHLQYLDWSDMNVPDDPRGVLDLVRKVEQAVAESTPGPNPSGSLSPGSRSGSLSGGQSPDTASDYRGYDTLLSPTSAGVVAGGRRRGGNGWRHPELDSKTGIAALALGKAAPVLLHCSAGVGRTGGFIAVDAVLDGIRRELRASREERRLKKAPRLLPERKIGMNEVEARGGFSVENAKTGTNSVDSCGEESISDESERMDVDEPPANKAEKTRDPPHMTNTVPIHVSAGERTKSRRHHYPSKHHSGEKQHSSSESLVVHVPYAGPDDIPEGTSVAGIDPGDPKEANWQSSSTREWVEQVSDQTRAHAGEGGLPLPPSLLPSSRERSPGSTSNTSGSSALNSADGSMTRSASASASGGGNRMERKSHAGSATGSSSGSGGPPPSSVSKPGSGSISFSNSGSGTGTGSRFGSSLLGTRFRDSSVTSISAQSTDALSLEHELKSDAPSHRPLAIRTGSSSDMEVDCAPRPASVPLQPAYSSMANHPRVVRPRHDRSIPGSSPVTSFSSHVLTPATAKRDVLFLGSDAAEGSARQPGSDLDSNKLPSPPQESENGESADAEDSGKNSQALSDESEELAVPTKSNSNLRLNTELSYLKVPETLHSDGSAKNPPVSSREAQGRERATIPPVPHTVDDSALLTAADALGALEHDLHAADYQVIDYKLPRVLHSDLSPPLISSFTEPICMVIQDMREQRMSLCQSLRQYVFVHAAIIEGALRIVDEEREVWGYSGTSDDTSSAESEPGANARRWWRHAGHGGEKAWSGVANEAGMAVVPWEHTDVLRRARPLHAIVQPANHWSAEGNIGTGQVPSALTSSSSGMSSPSKGKRGPSPTELLREDKSGAVSLNKRPSIHRKTTRNGGGQFPFESIRSSTLGNGNGEGSTNATTGVSATRPAPGRPAVPQKGGTTSGS